MLLPIILAVDRYAELFLSADVCSGVRQTARPIPSRRRRGSSCTACSIDRTHPSWRCTFPWTYRRGPIVERSLWLQRSPGVSSLVSAWRKYYSRRRDAQSSSELFAHLSEPSGGGDRVGRIEECFSHVCMTGVPSVWLSCPQTAPASVMRWCHCGSVAIIRFDLVSHVISRRLCGVRIYMGLVT
jgi:hypothetical protein